MLARECVEEEMIDITSPWRDDFPVLKVKVHGDVPLVFLDSAASAQKPQAVIKAMNDVIEFGYSNIHRGLYEISQNLTKSFEDVRQKVATFIKAESQKNIVFTRNTTEAINLVAQSWGTQNLSEGDEIILSEMEHHANIVPWQILAEKTGAVIKVIPLTEQGTLDLKIFEKLLSARTKLVSVVEISNALGTINSVNEIIKTTRKYNKDIVILIDGSQAIVHSSVNVTDMDVDFYVFTGHKLYGPTGIGVLYGKHHLLEAMPPYQSGGDMIERVSFKSGTTYREAPYKFEAGTPAILEVIGLGAAIDYLSTISMKTVVQHEHRLLEYAWNSMNEIDGLTILGPQNLARRAGILSFTMDCAHPSDIGMVLDQCGIAIRTGHHCAMPAMEALGLDATARVSLALYNDQSDVDSLIKGLLKVRELFG